jgi:hypothetical protein
VGQVSDLPAQAGSLRHWGEFPESAKGAAHITKQVRNHFARASFGEASSKAVTIL